MSLQRRQKNGQNAWTFHDFKWRWGLVILGLLILLKIANVNIESDWVFFVVIGVGVAIFPYHVKYG